MKGLVLPILLVLGVALFFGSMWFLQRADEQRQAGKRPVTYQRRGGIGWLAVGAGGSLAAVVFLVQTGVSAEDWDLKLVTFDLLAILAATASFGAFAGALLSRLSDD